jgi:RHS repeat-associated protein
VFDMRGDLDLDGDVDATDHSRVQALGGSRSGVMALSTSLVANARALSGMRMMASASLQYESRRRIIDAQLGGWLARDPQGYADGPSLYLLLKDSPIINVDPSGQYAEKCVARRVTWGGASSGRYQLHATFIPPATSADGVRQGPEGQPRQCSQTDSCNWHVRARIKLYRTTPHGDEPWSCPGAPGSEDEADCNMWHSSPLGRAPSGPIWTTYPPSNPPRRVPTPGDNASEFGPFGASGRDITAKCPENKLVCYKATSPVDSGVWTTICFVFACQSCPETPGHVGHPFAPPPSHSEVQ